MKTLFIILTISSEIVFRIQYNNHAIIFLTIQFNIIYYSIKKNTLPVPHDIRVTRVTS